MERRNGPRFSFRGFGPLPVSVTTRPGKYRTIA
jgi:hypothetical protein